MELYLASKDDRVFTRSWSLELRRSCHLFNFTLMLQGLLQRRFWCFSRSFFVDIFNQILWEILLVLKLGFDEPKRQKFQ